MRRRTLIGVGAALVGAGAAYQTGAFDNVVSDRQTSINSTDDPTAFLGLDGYDEQAPVPTFTNGFSNEIEVTLDSSGPNVEFDVDDNDSFEPVPVTFTLQPGETREVQVNGGAETVDVDISVTEYEDGSTVGSISLTRTFAVPASEQVDITGNVKSAGASGRYLFGLLNTGAFDVSLVGVGVVSSSNPNVEKVGGRSGDDVLVWDDNNQQLVFQEMMVDSSTDDAQVYTLDQSVPLVAEENGGEEQTLEFERFRHADNSNADMRGETVEVLLQFHDDSTTVELAADA